MKALLTKLIEWLRGRQKEPTKELLFFYDEYPAMKWDGGTIGGEPCQGQDLSGTIILENPVREDHG